MAEDIHENIDRFNRLTLAAFTILYENFPTRIDIDTKVLGVRAGQPDFAGDEAVKSALDWMGAARETIVWLTNEGFIRTAGSTMDGDFQQVVLTSKGMTTLGRVPHSVSDNPKHASFGELAGKTLKTGAKAAIGDFVKEMLAITARAAMTQLGVP